MAEIKDPETGEVQGQGQVGGNGPAAAPARLYFANIEYNVQIGALAAALVDWWVLRPREARSGVSR